MRSSVLSVIMQFHAKCSRSLRPPIDTGDKCRQIGPALDHLAPPPTCDLQSTTSPSPLRFRSPVLRNLLPFHVVCKLQRSLVNSSSRLVCRPFHAPWPWVGGPRVGVYCSVDTQLSNLEASGLHFPRHHPATLIDWSKLPRTKTKSNDFLCQSFRPNRLIFEFSLEFRTPEFRRN